MEIKIRTVNQSAVLLKPHSLGFVGFFAFPGLLSLNFYLNIHTLSLPMVLIRKKYITPDLTNARFIPLLVYLLRADNDCS